VKRIALVSIALLMLVVSGCSSLPNSMPPVPIIEPIVIKSASTGGIALIDSGKIYVGNFHSGARAEYALKVKNNKGEDTKVEISWLEPSKTEAGYAKAPIVVKDWIEGFGSYLVRKGETAEILVAVAMPDNAESPAPKWEFWLNVLDVGQMGDVQTALGSRWLITMRD